MLTFTDPWKFSHSKDSRFSKAPDLHHGCHHAYTYYWPHAVEDDTVCNNCQHYYCKNNDLNTGSAKKSIHRISSKSGRTLKSCCLRNVAACFCKLIPMNAPSKSRRMVKGRQLYTYVHEHYTHIQICLLCMCMHFNLCRRRPWNLAALELLLHQTGPWNKILPQWDFEEIRYTYCLLYSQKLGGLPLQLSN